MNHRLRLPARRPLDIIAMEHEGQRFKVCLGRATPDGPVVEVWLNAQQVNSPIDVLTSDGAILMSMLIQYGCPADEIIKSMKHNSDGKPASPLGVAAQLVADTFKAAS